MEHQRPTERPSGGKFECFDHIEFYVSNAKQVAAYYVLRFGFEYYAYKGLETGSRDVASHAVKQDKIILVFSSYMEPKEHPIMTEIAKSGDLVKDIAFRCTDARAIYAKAIERGAKSVQEPVEMKDENGSVIKATVATYGNVVHSFIQRNDYTGAFLPGFINVERKDPLSSLLPSPGLNFIDHVVGNMPDGEMKSACDWYENILDFHRFWTVDDTQVHTEYSALRSTVMTDFDRVIKMPINEPAEAKKKSQIQEYVDYYGGAGVQHIALNTTDVITAISRLRARGVEFLKVPNAYYEDLKKRLANSPVNITEDLKTIQDLGILVDFDDQGYLLQLFTKCVSDRPQLFFEVIQRNNHEGFGAGNFKALFESIEREQAARGNLEN